MAKTFAKIVEGIYWIINYDCCNKKKTYPYSSFRSKICKNEIYAKNWVRSTWTEKVNYGKKSKSKRKVNVDQTTTLIKG